MYLVRGFRRYVYLMGSRVMVNVSSGGQVGLNSQGWRALASFYGCLGGPP